MCIIKQKRDLGFDLSADSGMESGGQKAYKSKEPMADEGVRENLPVF